MLASRPSLTVGTASCMTSAQRKATKPPQAAKTIAAVRDEPALASLRSRAVADEVASSGSDGGSRDERLVSSCTREERRQLAFRRCLLTNDQELAQDKRRQNAGDEDDGGARRVAQDV